MIRSSEILSSFPIGHLRTALADKSTETLAAKAQNKQKKAQNKHPGSLKPVHDH